MSPMGRNQNNEIGTKKVNLEFFEKDVKKCLSQRIDYNTDRKVRNNREVTVIIQGS